MVEKTSNRHSVFIFKGYTVLDVNLTFEGTMFLQTQGPFKPFAQYNISEGQNSLTELCKSQIVHCKLIIEYSYIPF